MEPLDEVRRFFGSRVRALREHYGWQLDDIGKRLGKSRASMSRIEGGKQNLTLADIVAIAAILEVSVVELFPSGALTSVEPSAKRLGTIVTELSVHVQAQSLLLTEASAILEGFHASSHHRVNYWQRSWDILPLSLDLAIGVSA